ncbi:hypothetical protein BJY52DRAFT_1269629 [Lactarius psammicola]|nr:hypothetical protein BJY52DRAFT_1269629 [Lactarius psammicola]
MFIAHCFQGTFVGRATSFRVGIIKARFCRAILAQFFEEVDRNGTVVFRSQWDVASLARLFYILGVGGEEDAKFWKSFIDGGHVEAGFMTKAHDTLKIAVRDGPLLNFCRLGRLAVTMIPFKGSGLNDTDVEKLMELLQGMVDDSRLPLKSASAEVWEDLRRLRDEADHVISNCCDGDKDKLRQLFEKVEQVYEPRLFASQESGLSDHLRAPGSEPSAFAQPQLSSREPRLSHNRSSEATGSSTVVAEDRYEASPTRENDGESAIASNPYNADEIGSGGATAGPSAGAAYIPPPVLGNVFLAPQGISPVPPSFPYARQHPVMPVDVRPTRSASTLSTPRSPRLGSRDAASAEATSPPGHPNAVDGTQSDVSVIPAIY